MTTATTPAATSPIPVGVGTTPPTRRRISGSRWMFAIVVAGVVAMSIYALRDGGSQLYVQRVLDASKNGAIYGAGAVSLVLVFKATGIINFAQGPMAMFGTFVVYTLYDSAGVPIWIAILLGMALSAVAAAGMERVFVRPFDPTNHLAITIVTLAWYLVLGSLAAVIWGFDPRAFPTPFPSGVEDYVDIAGARLRYENLGVIVVAVVAVVGISWLLKRTRSGLAFRCVASNLDSSTLVGIDAGRTVQFSWALAAAAGTLAGSLVARSTYLEPHFMDKVLVYSFAAAALGGFDSVGGALVGGWLIALIVALVAGYVPFIGNEFALVSAFAILVLVLQFRPAGLFGTKRIERV